MARRAPQTPEAIERIRAANRAHWADPDRRAEHGALTRRRMARPGVSEKISERTRRALADPQIRGRLRSAVTMALASPVVRQRISVRTREAMADPAVRQRIRDGMARAARLRAELEPLRAIWRGLSDEARSVALREIGLQQTEGAAKAGAAPPVRFFDGRGALSLHTPTKP